MSRALCELLMLDDWSDSEYFPDCRGTQPNTIPVDAFITDFAKQHWFDEQDQASEMKKQFLSHQIDYPTIAPGCIFGLKLRWSHRGFAICVLHKSWNSDKPYTPNSDKNYTYSLPSFERNHPFSLSSSSYEQEYYMNQVDHDYADILVVNSYKYPFTNTYTTFSSHFYYNDPAKYRDVPSHWNYTTPMPIRSSLNSLHCPRGIAWILSEYLRKPSETKIKIVSNMIEQNIYSGISEPTIAIIVRPIQDKLSSKFIKFMDQIEMLLPNNLAIMQGLEYVFDIKLTYLNRLASKTKLTAEGLEYYNTNTKSIDFKDYPITLTFSYTSST